MAIAAAFEVSTRLTLASDMALERFHTSPLVGVFGAAIGAGKILGCDATAMAHALGLAGSYTGGLHAYYGGWLDAWIVNGARVNREGLLCANLAARGISGPLDIFESPRGFSAAFTDGRFDGDIAERGIGQDWMMLNAYIKMYPCCRRVHAVIDAAIELRTELAADTNSIDKIIVEVSAEGAQLDFKNPDSVAAAQMSMSYCAAIALEFGTPDLTHFEEATRQNPRVLRLVDRVEVRKAADPIIADPRQLSARVSLSIAGTTYAKTVKDPWGDPSNPVSDEDLVAKFHGLADPVIGRESAERLRTMIWNFDRSPGAEGERLRLKQFLANCRPQSSASVEQQADELNVTAG